MDVSRRIAAVVVSSLLVFPVVAQEERDRNKIPEKYRWNLAEIYPTEEAWREAKEKLAAQLPSIEQYKGRLGESGKTLADALEAGTRLEKEFYRTYVYASMMSDQDTRVSKYQGMVEEMRKLGADFSSKASFVEPEILAIGKEKIDGFIAQEPRLKIYRQYLDDIVRRAPHTLTASEEKIVADAGLMAGSPSSIYNIFANAEFPYPSVTLNDGKTVKLDQAAFQAHRASAVRADREKVMSAYFGKLGEFRGTFGADLNAKVQKDLFYMKARKYNTTLESTLDESNIPVSVYTSLVDGVNANLATFHRYLNLRKRLMGLDELHYYDLYAPLVPAAELKYPIEEAQKHVLASMAPLGSDYVAVVRKAFDERWIDLYPNEGKRSGAYSNGAAYDVHPYMLLNYNGKYDDMSTLTHELGHTMQSYFSNKTQPFPTANYPTFVAEVASTFNEALLIDYMLKNIKDDDARLSLLGNYLEGIKGTVFRQTQFAEFELRIHEMAEKGQPLTGETLDKVYMDITKKYYGHDQGVTVVDDYIAHEWSFIPHFYRNYYVFQYATSFTASAALSEKVMAGDKTAIKRYRDFLAAGGSKYPIQLLKEAGVDMTTSEPLELTMKKMNRVMDEMERILAKKQMKKKAA